MTQTPFALRADAAGSLPGDAADLAAALLGPAYRSLDELGRGALRERYCLAQLILHPDARLDPRSEESFLHSLTAAGIIALEEPC